MSVNEGLRAKTIQVSGKPLKKCPEKLPWPRMSETPDAKGQFLPMGVDVVAKRPDIIKIVHKFFKVESVPMEELLQEVFVAIIHKNYTRSAHNPTKSSFGHYVYMVANNVCINLVHRKRRYDKESDSIDAPSSCDDQRTLLDTVESREETRDPVQDNLEDVEFDLRRRGMWDCARYIRAARSGAGSDVIREALSWGTRKISSKAIRDIRVQIQNAIRVESVAAE